MSILLVFFSICYFYLCLFGNVCSKVEYFLMLQFISSLRMRLDYSFFNKAGANILLNKYINNLQVTNENRINLCNVLTWMDMQIIINYLIVR